MLNIDEIMENIVINKGIFTNEEIGCKMYMVENMLFIKDCQLPRPEGRGL